MHEHTTSGVTGSNNACELVWATYEALGSWHKVGEELGVSSAMAWRVAKQGYEPKDPEIRKKLGFPEIIQVKVHRNKEGKFSKAGK